MSVSATPHLGWPSAVLVLWTQETDQRVWVRCSRSRGCNLGVDDVNTVEAYCPRPRACSRSSAASPAGGSQLTALAKVERRQRRLAMCEAHRVGAGCSGVKRVYMVGRRGPVQGAFTPKELREMLSLPNVKVRFE
jgi:hypothetical protein